jgi:hypothetical protein
MLFLFFYAGVVIGLEREDYRVSEGTGAVEVCAIVLRGALDRELVLELSTSDKTAQGKYNHCSYMDRSRFTAVKEIWWLH